jgi:uncharacterized protein (DUF488 family)
MLTSYYAHYQGPAAISISRVQPAWYPFSQSYKPLAPGPWFKSVSQTEYIRRYHREILSFLRPQKVWDELHSLTPGTEPVLLCYETSHKFCHRHLVAQWFTYAGFPVTELGQVQETAEQLSLPGLFG